jgi:hypothetical protein
MFGVRCLAYDDTDKMIALPMVLNKESIPDKVGKRVGTHVGGT